MVIVAVLPLALSLTLCGQHQLTEHGDHGFRIAMRDNRVHQTVATGAAQVILGEPQRR
jgi:hypothetical protein